MSGPEPGRNRLYSLREIDEYVLPQVGRVKLTIEEVILLLLYADPSPVEGRARLMMQVFLATKEVFRERDVEPPAFEGRRLGPHSAHVERAVGHLAFSGNVRTSGDRRRSDFGIGITPRGRARTRPIYDALPPRTRRMLAQKRAEWDTLTTAGLRDHIYVHNREYLENAARRDGFRAEWGGEGGRDADGP